MKIKISAREINIVRGRLAVVRYCPNCGKGYTEGKKYCPNCGASLKRKMISQEIEENDTSNFDKWKFFLIIAILILCGILSFLIFNPLKDSRQKAGIKKEIESKASSMESSVEEKDIAPIKDIDIEKDFTDELESFEKSTNRVEESIDDSEPSIALSRLQSGAYITQNIKVICLDGLVEVKPRIKGEPSPNKHIPIKNRESEEQNSFKSMPLGKGLLKGEILKYPMGDIIAPSKDSYALVYLGNGSLLCLSPNASCSIKEKDKSYYFDNISGTISFVRDKKDPRSFSIEGDNTKAYFNPGWYGLITKPSTDIPVQIFSIEENATTETTTGLIMSIPSGKHGYVSAEEEYRTVNLFNKSIMPDWLKKAISLWRDLDYKQLP